MPVFHREVTLDLADVFGELAKIINVMGTEIYQIQDQWWEEKELHMTNDVAKGSTKNLCYFLVVLLIKSPKIIA